MPINATNTETLKYYSYSMKEAVSSFKYAQYFDPNKINELKPTSNDIVNLRVLIFLDTNTIINGLKTELAYYTAKANGLSLDVDKLDWWKQHETELPLWFSSCKSVLLIQPSSAAAPTISLI